MGECVVSEQICKKLWCMLDVWHIGRIILAEAGH